MGEQGVGGHGQPFGGFAVGRHDGGLGLVAFDDDFVEVAGFGGVEGPQREVVDDQDIAVFVAQDGLRNRDDPFRRREIERPVGNRRFPAIDPCSHPLGRVANGSAGGNRA